MSKLLTKEPPLVIQPSLAREIGLNEAIVLQQVHYWLQRSRHRIDGVLWVYNSYPKWQQQFSFWSVETVKRTIVSLERKGLLKSGNFNKMKADKTKWYTIDYGVARRLAGSCAWLSAEEKYVRDGTTTEPSRADHEVDLTRPIGQIDPTIPETSPEITSETTPPTQMGSPEQRDPVRKQPNGGGAVSEDEHSTYESKYPEIAKSLDEIGIWGSNRLVVLKLGDHGYSERDLRKIWDSISRDESIRNPQGAFINRCKHAREVKPSYARREYEDSYIDVAGTIVSRIRSQTLADVLEEEGE
jgi:hypothetical protein